MIKQTQLNFKLWVTEDEITPRAGLAVYSEFLTCLRATHRQGGFGIKDLIDRQYASARL